MNLEILTMPVLFMDYLFSRLSKLNIRSLDIDQCFIVMLSLGQTLSTFHYTLLDKCRALLSVVERGWPNALDFSLDLELNIPLMYCLNK